MRIAIVSNCQGESIAQSMWLMNPTLATNFFMASDVSAGHTASLTQIIDSYDKIFVQKGSIDFADVVENNNEKISIFPNIAFSGYHPDMTYVRGSRDGKTMESVHTPMYTYNSKIVFYAYMNGKSVEETIEMFNADTFERLGYLEEWNESKEILFEESSSVGIDLSASFRGWEKRGIFMHSFNHPAIYVLSDLSALLLQKENIEIRNHNVSQFISDPLARMPVWPLYPAIADKLGYIGDYAFKKNEHNHIEELESFVRMSFASYDTYLKVTLDPINFSLNSFSSKLISNEKRVPKGGAVLNPYKELPKYNFWKYAVAEPAMGEVDPVAQSKFSIHKDDKVATAGSCFAQHIAKTLSKDGFNYFVSEQAPDTLSLEDSANKNYGVFSARYGNVYTVKQLLQLMKRAYGLFRPLDDAWVDKNGKFIDPFRPQIEPDGFDSISDLHNSRDEHLKAVREMLESMDIFIFTLGLTEGWRSTIDGAVFPLSHGVVSPVATGLSYEFINFDVDEIREDLYTCIDFIKELNPSCKILLTVSPVPLIATYENQNALTATTYSKSVLRVVAEEMSKVYSHVAYFPSYEIIVGHFNKGSYYEDDLRSVKPEGVSHVMRLFAQHYMRESDMTHKLTEVRVSEAKQTSSEQEDVKKRNIFRVVCDEEAIANFN